MAKMVTLRDRLAAGFKQSAEQGDEVTAQTLRLVLAAINERDACARESGIQDGIDDDAIREMLNDMVAQRRAEIDRCESGARLELAAQEADEIDVLQRYLPKPLSDVELTEAIDETISSMQATKLKDVGPVLAGLKQRFNGNMDVARAKRMICERLA